MTTDPFKSFLPVIDVNTLIDVAFKRGSSKSAAIPQKLPKLEKAKRKEIKRIQNVNKYLIDRIDKIIKSVPNLDDLHVFYQELSNLLVSNDELRKNLGKLNGVIPVLKRLESDLLRKIKTQTDSYGCASARREYFARASSILKKQRDTLIFLEEARKKLKKIPTIDVTLPSVVVAGYPNVGKSSLVSKISTADPEIREYPFTTKNIVIGVYKEEGDLKIFQIIDTPGVLDRPMHKRNEIEKQSILALRIISNIVIYIIDPTESCGFSLDSQIALFGEIKKNLIDVANIPFIVILNKMDLTKKEEITRSKELLGLDENIYLQTDALNGTNLDLLINRLKDIIIEKGLLKLNLERFGR